MPPLVFFPSIMLNAKPLFSLKAKFGKKRIERFLIKESTQRLDAFPNFFPKKLVIENVRDLIDNCFIFFGSI